MLILKKYKTIFILISLIFLLFSCGTLFQSNQPNQPDSPNLDHCYNCGIIEDPYFIRFSTFEISNDGIDGSNDSELIFEYDIIGYQTLLEHKTLYLNRGDKIKLEYPKSKDDNSSAIFLYLNSIKQSKILITGYREKFFMNFNLYKKNKYYIIESEKDKSNFWDKNILLTKGFVQFIRIEGYFYGKFTLTYQENKFDELFNPSYYFNYQNSSSCGEYCQYRSLHHHPRPPPPYKTILFPINRKFWLNNNWATGAVRVEFIEKDFNLQYATIGQALSWKTYGITTTTISRLSSAKVYQTRVEYTGPLYYKIFDANTNSLLLESVIRGYPLITELDFPKLNWQKRLTTTQIKSLYYPYEYEYFTSFQ